MQLMWGGGGVGGTGCSLHHGEPTNSVSIGTALAGSAHTHTHTHTHGKMNVRNYVFLIRKFLCCDDVVKSANRVSVINQGKSKIFKRLHAENCAEAIL